ncbi:MAG: COP23 domain-containing protein [Pleurocapsa sp.]
MSIKHLSALLAGSALVVGTTPAWAESSPSPDLSFTCQTGEIPTTVAQTADGSVSKPVFNWKSDVLSGSADAEQLCNQVAAKLQEYSAQGYDLSTMSFNGLDQGGLPAICVAGEANECDKLLFTLTPTERPANEADRVLAGILDKSLQGERVQSRDRGIMATSYKVNFWDLFGLGFPKLLK